MKKSGLILSTIVALSSSAAWSGSLYTCTNGSNTRIIEVVYPSTEGKLPCEVQYEKNGEVKTLWTSKNQEGFCESKASEFADKQKGWGWDCKHEVLSDVVSQPEDPAAQAPMAEEQPAM